MISNSNSSLIEKISNEVIQQRELAINAIRKRYSTAQDVSEIDTIKDDFIAMDLTLYENSVIVFELTGMNGEYGNFLKSYEKDIDRIKSVVSRIAKAPEKHIDHDYDYNFGKFKEHLLCIHDTEKSYFHIEGDAPVLFTSMRLTTHQIAKYLELESIDDYIKVKAMREMLEALPLCAANLSVKMESCLSFLQSSTGSLDARLNVIKEGVIRKIGVDYAPTLIRQLKLRNANYVSDQYHEHYGNYLQQLLRPHWGVVDLDDRFFSAISLRKSELDAYKKYLEGINIDKKILEQLVTEVMSLIIETFRKHKVNFNETPCLLADDVPNRLEIDLEQNVYSLINGFFMEYSPNKLAVKNISSSNIIPLDWDTNFYLEHTERLVTRWLAFAFTGFASASIIFDCEQGQIYTHGGICSWYINKQDEDEYYWELGEHLNISHLELMKDDLWQLDVEVLVGLLEDAVINTSNKAQIAKLITSPSILYLLRKTESPKLIALVQHCVDIYSEGKDSTTFLYTVVEGITIDIKKNPFSISTLTAFKNSHVFQALVPFSLSSFDLAYALNWKVDDLLLMGNHEVTLLINENQIFEKQLTTELKNALEDSCINKAIKLILCGCDINAVNTRGQTALHLAIKNHYQGGFSALLNCDGINLNQADCNGVTPFLQSCSCNTLYFIESLLKQGKVKVNTKDTTHNHPFHFAAANSNNCQLIPLLLLICGHKQINDKNVLGVTPLMLATQNKNSDNTETLLAVTNIIINLEDNDGNTALHYAVSAENYKAANSLIKTENIDINSKNSKGDTILHFLARNKSVTEEKLVFLTYLLDMESLQVNIANSKGYTALMLAIRKKQIPIIKLLIQSNKIDLTINDNQGKSYKEYALRTKNEEIIVLFN